GDLLASLRRHGLGDGLGHPAVEDAGDDEGRVELVRADDAGDRHGGDAQYLVGDLRRAGVEQAPEEAREGEDVVDLVGVVAAAGGDDGGGLPGLERVDLGHRVGQGEDDGALVHPGDVGAGEDVARGHPDEDVGTDEGLPQRAGEGGRAAVLDDPLAVDVRPGALYGQCPVAVAPDDVAGALGHEELDDRRAGGTDAGDDDPHVLDRLPHHAQGVDERGEDDDGGAVLVVVEDGDVQLLAQPGLDLEAAGGGDVLEVDAAEPG